MPKLLPMQPIYNEVIDSKIKRVLDSHWQEIAKAINYNSNALDSTAPSVSQSLSVTTYDGNYLLTWQSPSIGYLSLDNYAIIYSANADFSSAKILQVGKRTSYLFSDPGKSYYFAIAAHNLSGDTLTNSDTGLAAILSGGWSVWLYWDGVTGTVIKASAIVVTSAGGSSVPGAGSITSVSQFVASIRPVVIVATKPTLPSSDYPIGSTIVWTTDGKLYRNVSNVWSTTIYATDLGDQVQAGQLAVNSVIAGTIEVGALDGILIIGSEIATDTSGARCVMNEGGGRGVGGFKSYDSYGNWVSLSSSGVISSDSHFNYSTHGDTFTVPNLIIYGYGEIISSLGTLDPSHLAGFPNDSSKFLRGDGTWATGTGGGSGGDVYSSATTSVDSELAIFDGTGGKTIKRASASGVAILTSGVLSTTTIDKAYVGLESVENIALSTWAGTINITTLGTIATGLWHGTAIEDSYIYSSSVWNAKISAASYDTLQNKGIAIASCAFIANDLKLLGFAFSFTANRVVTWQDADGTVALTSQLAGYVPTSRTINGYALSGSITLVKGDIGLGNVENIALSTWTGSSYITTLSTIITGQWGDGRYASSPPVYTNGLRIVSSGGGQLTFQFSGARGATLLIPDPYPSDWLITGTAIQTLTSKTLSTGCTWNGNGITNSYITSIDAAKVTTGQLASARMPSSFTITGAFGCAAITCASVGASGNLATSGNVLGANVWASVAIGAGSQTLNDTQIAAIKAYCHVS